MEQKKLKFVSLDLETTGLVAGVDQIIEVGMIKFDRLGEIARYESLVFCEQKLSGIVKKITNIDEEELLVSPEWVEVKEKIEDFLDDEQIVLVGHNIAFDLAFLRAAGVNVDNYQIVDSWELSAMVIFDVSSYSLEYLAKYIGYEFKAHRAMNDAIAVMYLFRYILGRMASISDGMKKKISMIVTKSDLKIKNILDEAWMFEMGGEKRSVFEKPIWNNFFSDIENNELKSDRLLVEKDWDEFVHDLSDKNLVWLMSDRVFGDVGKGKSYWKMFDQRSNYICRGNLAEIWRRTKIENNLAMVLIKILFRISQGYWDGYIKQVLWSREEWKVMDELRCEGELCAGDCFFDRRLQANLQEKQSIIVTNGFLHENKLDNYKELKYWCEKVLLEDGLTEMFSYELNCGWWQTKLELMMAKEKYVGQKKLLDELRKNISMMNGLVTIYIKSKGVKNDYGWSLDVSPMIKMEKNYQNISDLFREISRVIEVIMVKSKNINLHFLRRFCQEMIEQNSIAKFFIDKENNTVVKVYNEKFDLGKWGNFSNIEISSQVLDLNNEYYGDFLLSESFEKKVKEVKQVVVENYSKNGLGIELLKENGYNLAVFSSRYKLEVFDELVANNVVNANVFHVKDLKKRGWENVANGWLLCTQNELADWKYFKNKFDVIYINDLIFDIPGELVGSWRSLEFGNDAFEKYNLARMMIRFKFILNLIKPNGRLLIGDGRFFTRSYGKKLMKILGV